MKKSFDRHHCEGDQLELGEIVFIKCPATAKLQPKYRGPMVIVMKVAKDIYRVQDLRREGSDHGLVDLYISQLRPWLSSELDDDFKDVPIEDDWF